VVLLFDVLDNSRELGGSFQDGSVARCVPGSNVFMILTTRTHLAFRDRSENEVFYTYRVHLATLALLCESLCQLCCTFGAAASRSLRRTSKRVYCAARGSRAEM